MQRRGFLAGILAAGMAPAIVHNPMKIWVPKQGIQTWGPKIKNSGISGAYMGEAIPSIENGFAAQSVQDAVAAIRKEVQALALRLYREGGYRHTVETLIVSSPSSNRLQAS